MEPELAHRERLQAIGRARGAFIPGEARTLRAAHLGGLASAALIDEETKAERSKAGRQWWARFTAAERRAMVRARLKNHRHSGHKPGWTLELPVDHPGLNALRRNGIEQMRKLTLRQQAERRERVQRAHRAYYFEHRALADIAAELGVALATVADYLRVPLDPANQIRFL
jgi:hypothetical protein